MLVYCTVNLTVSRTLLRLDCRVITSRNVDSSGNTLLKTIMLMFRLQWQESMKYQKWNNYCVFKVYFHAYLLIYVKPFKIFDTDLAI